MTCSAGPDEETVKKAISEAGYIYKGMIVPKEEMKMKETVRIEGMMCGHCVAHVTKALEGMNGVEKAEVSLENKNAVVTLSADVSDKALSATIVDAGYEVVGIS